MVPQFTRPPREDKWEEGHGCYLHRRLPAGPGKELGLVLAGPTEVPAKLSNTYSIQQKDQLWSLPAVWGKLCGTRYRDQGQVVEKDETDSLPHT